MRQSPANPGVSPATAAAGVANATVGAGAAVTATLASVCCAGPVVGPIVVGLVGASGAAAAAGLKPYTPYLYAASFAMLAFGFFTSYRKRSVCTPGSVSRATLVWIKLPRAVLWTAAAIWVASILVTTYYATHG